MSMSLRCRAPVATASRPSRSATVVVRAGMVDDIAKGFARIFTPLSYGNKEDWTGTGSGFTGKIKHHGQAGERKPFKDDWSAAPRPVKSRPQQQVAGQAESAEPEAQPKAQEQQNIVSFLGGAAERVVAHNFTGDGTEPALWAEGGGSTVTGFSGKIHTRGKDGFHATKK